MENLTAERAILLVEPSGERRRIELLLGRPEKISDRTWSCKVRLEGLPDSVKDSVGIDSWQALTIGIAVARQSLMSLIHDGAHLYWEEDGEEMDLDDLFPQFD